MPPSIPTPDVSAGLGPGTTTEEATRYVHMQGALAAAYYAVSSEDVTIDDALRGFVFEVPTQALPDSDNTVEVGCIATPAFSPSAALGLTRVAPNSWEYELRESSGAVPEVTGVLTDAQVFDQKLAVAFSVAGNTVTVAFFTAADPAAPFAVLSYDHTGGGADISPCNTLYAAIASSAFLVTLYTAKALGAYTGFLAFGASPPACFEEMLLAAPIDGADMLLESPVDNEPLLFEVPLCPCGN